MIKKKANIKEDLYETKLETYHKKLKIYVLNYVRIDFSSIIPFFIMFFNYKVSHMFAAHSSPYFSFFFFL